MKIAVCGIMGRMGSLLAENLLKDSRFELLFGLDRDFSAFESIPVYPEFPEELIPDVIVDFSNPSLMEKLLSYAIKHSVALVIATTGQNDEEKKLIHIAAQLIPIFYSSNLSYGIHVVCNILKMMAKEMENFDVEIIERHHRHKADAPSGTAILLANKILANTDKEHRLVFGRNGKRNSEIGIHSVRGGTIIGDHSVLFAGEDESIEILHHAQSKAIFVHGAIKAALFIARQKPGLYSMDDLV